MESHVPDYICKLVKDGDIQGAGNVTIQYDNSCFEIMNSIPCTPHVGAAFTPWHSLLHITHALTNLLSVENRG